MTLYVGQANEHGHVLIFDMWANEENCRIEAWRLLNGDVRLVFVHAGVGYQPSLTLASYRADDLRDALAGRTGETE